MDRFAGEREELAGDLSFRRVANEIEGGDGEVGAVQGELVMDWEWHWGALAIFVGPPYLAVEAVQGELVMDWEWHWGALAHFVGPPYLVGREEWVELGPSATHLVEGANLMGGDLVWGAWGNSWGVQENFLGGQIDWDLVVMTGGHLVAEWWDERLTVVDQKVGE